MKTFLLAAAMLALTAGLGGCVCHDHVRHHDAYRDVSRDRDPYCDPGRDARWRDREAVRYRYRDGERYRYGYSGRDYGYRY